MSMTGFCAALGGVKGKEVADEAEDEPDEDEPGEDPPEEDCPSSPPNAAAITIKRNEMPKAKNNRKSTSNAE